MSPAAPAPPQASGRAVRFVPCGLRGWNASPGGNWEVHATGWAEADGVCHEGPGLARHIAAAVAKGAPLPGVLAGLEGNFAVVVLGPEGASVAADRIRSIPLLLRAGAGSLVVSDGSGPLLEPGAGLDPDSVREFAVTGYVTGPHTLHQGLRALQAGEVVTWTPQHGLTASSYFAYRPAFADRRGMPELVAALDEAVLDAFRRTLRSIGDRPVWVPLSGGLDSRLVAATLRRLGRRDVVCFSYGLPGNAESRRSAEVAKALGYPWRFVPYTAEGWRETLGSDDHRRFQTLAGNSISLPHPDEWPAIRALARSGDVPQDAVFMPGHTGDFLCGSHLKYLLDPAWNPDPTDLRGALARKHHHLWADLAARPDVARSVRRRLDEALQGADLATEEGRASAYEAWEWRERQAKFILNSVRTYEMFGFGWRVPLWDGALMAFWSGVPIHLRLSKRLYREYLARVDPGGVFGPSVRPPPPGSSAPANGLHAAGTRWSQARAHLRHLSRQPLGMARGYGLLRYALRDPWKRHEHALYLRDFMRDAHGVDLHAPVAGAPAEAMPPGR